MSASSGSSGKSTASKLIPKASNATIKVIEEEDDKFPTFQGSQVQDKRQRETQTRVKITIVDANSFERTNEQTEGEKVELAAIGDSQTQDKQHHQSEIRFWWGDHISQESGTHQAKIPDLSDIEGATGRAQWTSYEQFVLSCLGGCVGLGNIWKFPFLAYANGGAAFLFAHVILQVLVGQPMFLMECVVGQFSRKGPTKIWDMNPAAKGIGISMCIMSATGAVYYSVVICYTLYYFFASMQPTLPWSVCRDEWTNCVSRQFPQCTLGWKTENGLCTCTGEFFIDSFVPHKCVKHTENISTAADLYFYKSVLQLSPGLEPENIGTPLPWLALYLFITLACVAMCLIKGIKVSGKVLYFTSVFPYVILLALLIRNIFRDGALDGALFFLIPSWSKLADIRMWALAASQMFFSLNVAFGGIIMCGSFNRFENNMYSDALIVATGDLVTSIIGGLVVFTTFGVMAKNIGSTVDKVAKSGYGLAFIVYPEALSSMPLTNIWALFFFLMLFTLGVGSEFMYVQTVMTGLQDEFPILRLHKRKFLLVFTCICYLLALPCICPGGDYVATLLDHYGLQFPVLYVAFLEVVALSFGYSSQLLLKDLDYMVGRRPLVWQYWAFCWTVVSPVVLGLLLLSRSLSYNPPNDETGKPFSVFAQIIGWAISVLTLSAIPLWFLYLVIKAFTRPEILSWKDRLKFLFYPNRHWMPNDGRLDVKPLEELDVPDVKSPKDLEVE